MSNARLMKPLFYDGNFNRDGKKMRAVFEREISDGTVSYRLWRSDGKPDIQYPRAENDNYLLYAEIRDYLVPLRITDFYLIDHAGYPAAVAELYGNKDARNDYFDNLRKSGDDAVLEAVRRERERIMLLGSDPACQASYIKKLFDKCWECRNNLINEFRTGTDYRQGGLFFYCAYPRIIHEADKYGEVHLPSIRF